MIRFDYINHGEATFEIKERICTIKDTSWHHGIKNQMQWLESHLKDTDIHLMAYTEGGLVAYLNLIDLNIAIDGKTKKALGIGNVCSAEKGIGYGKMLVEEVNVYLNKHNKIGILLCKQNLVNFYNKYNWSLIDKSRIVF